MTFSGNIGKDLSQLDGLECPDQDGEFYLSHQNTNKYLNEYADKFNLRKDIQVWRLFKLNDPHSSRNVEV